MHPAHMLHLTFLEHIDSTYRRGTLNFDRFRGSISGDGTAYVSLRFKKPHVINATVHFGLCDSPSNVPFLQDVRDFAQAGIVSATKKRSLWIVNTREDVQRLVDLMLASKLPAYRVKQMEVVKEAAAMVDPIFGKANAVLSV